MANTIRRQLTLFVAQNDAEKIEEIRQKFNPIQFALIKAHVTLCREDEIINIDKVISNLLSFSPTAIAIAFEKVKRFENGKGLLFPAAIDNTEFQALRKQVLTGVTDNPKKQKPHITLMNPRNSTCTDIIFEKIKKINFPSKLKFQKISLIEQINGGQWKIIKEFELLKRIINNY